MLMRQPGIINKKGVGEERINFNVIGNFDSEQRIINEALVKMLTVKIGR